MKRKYFSLTVVLLLSTLIYSCKKNGIQIIDKPLDTNTPQIKYFNFSVGSPAVNFYANDVKVAGILSATGAESTTALTYGSVYPASNYSLLVASDYAFKAQLSSTITTDANLAIANLSSTVANNKFYSLYTCGLYNSSTKKSDAFFLEDKLPAINYSVAYVRFVNTIPNAPANMNLYALNTTVLPATETLIASNVAFKTASEFIAIPMGVYELYVRYPAAPTVNVISRNGTTNGSVSFVGGRVYTIGSRGDIAITSATAINRPLIDNTANR